MGCARFILENYPSRISDGDTTSKRKVFPAFTKVDWNPCWRNVDGPE
jgi:hypothetical protein